MAFTRSQHQYFDSGSDSTFNDDSLRVNIYGEELMDDAELEAVTDGVKQMLDENIGTQGALGGYDLYSYHTSKYFDLTFSDTADDMIRSAYDSISGSAHEDEHALVIWAYWSHPSDLSTCGPNSDPCPPAFMMGHDIDNNAKFPADQRQPFVHIPPSEMDLNDIMMGFIPVNDNEKDPVTSKPAAAHELGHALVNSSVCDDGLVSFNTDSHPDHTLGHRQFHQNFGINYNTIMSMASNPTGTQNGQCSSPSSDQELIKCSSCTDTAIEQTLTYYKQNV